MTGTRQLDAREMMAMRMALEIEKQKLEKFVKNTVDPHAQAGYRIRLETVNNLLQDMAPGGCVMVAK